MLPGPAGYFWLSFFLEFGDFPRNFDGTDAIPDPRLVVTPKAITPACLPAPSYPWRRADTISSLMTAVARHSKMICSSFDFDPALPMEWLLKVDFKFASISFTAAVLLSCSPYSWPASLSLKCSLDQLLSDCSDMFTSPFAMFLNFDIWMCNSLLQYLGRLLDIFRQCRLAHACSPESGDRFTRLLIIINKWCRGSSLITIRNTSKRLRRRTIRKQ